MATTIPQLDPISQIQATDVIMITHADGTTERITGENFMKAMAVDVIAENNMNSVTSNAVARAFKPVNLTLNVVHSGAIYKAVRFLNIVMVHVHTDGIAVSYNERSVILSGLPVPAGSIVPTGIIDWGGLSIQGNTEINQSGQLLVVGNSNVSSGTTVIVDSVITYICQ